MSGGGVPPQWVVKLLAARDRGAVLQVFTSDGWVDLAPGAYILESAEADYRVKPAPALPLTATHGPAHAEADYRVKPAPALPLTATHGTAHAEPAVLRTPAPTLDMQVGGDHYRKHGAMQPWCIIDHYGLNYWEASALSYILRSKDPAKRAEDLRKAAHYLEHQAQRIEAGK